MSVPLTSYHDLNTLRLLHNPQLWGVDWECPPKLIFFNLWLQSDVAGWEGLGSVTLLEEVCYRQVRYVWCSHHHSSFLGLLVVVSTCKLSVVGPATFLRVCCHASHHNDHRLQLSGTMSPHIKYFLLISCLGHNVSHSNRRVTKIPA